MSSSKKLDFGTGELYTACAPDATDQQETLELVRSCFFKTALQNLPHAEVRAARELLAARLSPEEKKQDPQDDEKLRVFLVINRHKNAMCSGMCGRKKMYGHKLFHCSRCALVFYCSTRCQKKDWAHHKQWCCNLQAPFDPQDPYAPVIGKVQP